MPFRMRQRVSSRPRMWHSSTAPPGVTALPDDGSAYRPHDAPVFELEFGGQADEGVVDSVVGPLGQALQDREHQLEGLQRVLLIGLHLLVAVQLVGVPRQGVEEVHLGSDIQPGVAAGLDQGSDEGEIRCPPCGQPLR